MTNRNISSFQPSQNGRYDDDILCAACDNILGADEKYAFETLAVIRRSVPHIVDRMFGADGIQGDRLLRFAAGIVWKYALTKENYGRIDIGPYAEKLQEMLFGDVPPPREINAFLMKLHSGDDEPYFYRAPLLDRHKGINFIRFSVGGFVFFVKLDRRDAAWLPMAGWLSGNSNILIPAMRYDALEEGRMVLSARKANERLDAYLEKVSLNSSVQ
jgi:hypothetical protein